MKIKLSALAVWIGWSIFTNLSLEKPLDGKADPETDEII